MSNVVNRTHFRRRPQGDPPDVVWQWYWQTKANNEQIVAVGGEGYDKVHSAINGFMAGQGLPDWKPGDPFPEQYRVEKFDDYHYVITKYEVAQQQTGE